MNWELRKFSSPVSVLYCSTVPQQHCLEYGQKNLPGPGNMIMSTTTDLHKGYHPLNTAGEGGPAEKSQECADIHP